MQSIDHFLHISFRQLRSGRLLKHIFTVLPLVMLSGCSSRLPDVERVNYDTYAIKSYASTFYDPTTAKQKAEYDAAHYCALEGRDAVIKNIKSLPRKTLGDYASEIEFRCVPSSSESAAHNNQNSQSNNIPEKSTR